MSRESKWNYYLRGLMASTLSAPSPRFSVECVNVFFLNPIDDTLP